MHCSPLLTPPIQPEVRVVDVRGVGVVDEQFDGSLYLLQKRVVDTDDVVARKCRH